MTSSTGQTIAHQTVRLINKDGANDVETSSIFDGKRVILVGVPGAFTPTCSDNHIPGYLENADAIFARGVDDIIVVTVNDHFVVSAWSERLSAGDRLSFIADWDGAFSKALEMDMDLSAGGLGVRAKRFSMLVENGTIQSVHTEDNPGAVSTSGADVILAEL